MKTLKRYGILLSMLYLFFMSGCQSDARSWELPPVDSLRNGDIVFRKGGSAANIFLNAANSKGIYTHSGIVVIENGRAMVVHSVPDEAVPGDYDRVKKEPIEDFFLKIRAFSGGIYRVKGMDSTTLRSVTNEAVRWYEKGVGFDCDYILGDTTKIYCTELLVLSFDRVGYDITAGNYTDLNSTIFVGRYIFPSDVLANQDLERVVAF